jgi:4-hydroxy 2-oxovalerate aldolase
MDNAASKFIRVVDTTLRDGMHSVAHQFTLQQMKAIAGAMDAAGVDTIEVSHGDGLGGSSLQYGRSAETDEAYLQAVSSVLTRSKLAVLLLPGVGTRDDLDMAVSNGATVARIATHVTEADISEQHVGMAKKRGMEVLIFLMMAHMAPIEVMVHNAKLMESYGADYVYVVDSAGYMLPPEAYDRVAALRANLKCKVGFHAHNNLGAGIANSLEAIKAGAEVVDGSLRSFGGGGGNTATELLIAVLDRMGIQTGVDLFKIMDAAKLLDPLKSQPKEGPDAVLMLGYAGVYSSFLLHTARAAERFGVDPRRILVELGRRRVVGGQEDMIIDVAYELAQQKA